MVDFEVLALTLKSLPPLLKTREYCQAITILGKRTVDLSHRSEFSQREIRMANTSLTVHGFVFFFLRKSCKNNVFVRGQWIKKKMASFFSSSLSTVCLNLLVTNNVNFLIITCRRFSLLFFVFNHYFEDFWFNSCLQNRLKTTLQLKSIFTFKKSLLLMTDLSLWCDLQCKDFFLYRKTYWNQSLLFGLTLLPLFSWS